MTPSSGPTPAVSSATVFTYTTIAGLAELESRAVRGALIQAVVAATRRSEELGRLAGEVASNES